MRYTLHANGGGIKLKLYYPNAGAYQVFANGNLIEYTPWYTDPITRQGGPSELTKIKGCGENRFVGVVNFLEFYITAGCDIRVEPLDQIFSSVRLSWTLEEFYADGGTTTFTDRVAATLGVPAWRIKTVAVYEGSVVIDWFLLPDPDAEDPTAELDDMGRKLTQILESSEGSEMFGAPLIGVSTNGETLFGTNVNNNNAANEAATNMGTSTLISDWLADREERING